MRRTAPTRINGGTSPSAIAFAAALALLAGCASDGGLKPEATLVDPASLRLSRVVPGAAVAE